MAPPPELQRIDEALWQLPTSYKPGMRVPARVYGTPNLIDAMDAGVFDQVTNIATLPGVVDYAMCMPDGHWGYGFPIGGMVATDIGRGGVISPGGIGFDVNCGMRLVRTNLTLAEIQPYVRRLVDRLFERVPAGVGRHGLLKLSEAELGEVAEQGARWCLARGYGRPQDLELTEEQGCVAGADAEKISFRAIQRGLGQIGTLGSGNHYLEIQTARSDQIYDAEAARVFGIDRDDQVVIMFHCGSRGFGHQVATDYLRRFLDVMTPKYGIEVRDRELVCAPFESPEGRDYFAAMNCAINISFANRQVILHRIREVFEEVLGRSAEDLGLEQVYDVAHNTAKLEEHETASGERRRLLVHRKGATRAFGPNMDGVPEVYRSTGQPVIIGGSMETGSFLLVGQPEGRQSFFTTAHGSGRTMSRRQATKQWNGRKLQRELEHRGIYVRSTGYRGLAEEAGGAYKDIDEVVKATQQAGLSRPVARFTPIGNIKG